MNKKKQIPVHKMDDWLSGIYIKPAGKSKSAFSNYEISQPHRHDFYYCVLLDKGKIEVDFKKVRLSDLTLFLSYPGQVHQINSAKMERGWFLAFDPSILSEQLKHILDQCLSEVIQIPLSPEQSADFNSHISYLYKVYNNSGQLFQQPVIHSLATAFVYQIASIYLTIEKFSLIKYPTRSIEITKKFMQILRHNYKALKKPFEYAAKMNITATYLNDTIRTVTGFTVTYFIQQELMREAQRLLYYSDISVKEVAYALGYEDDKYFNRLFSKIIGVSPGVFRKNGEPSSHISNSV